jgi:glycine betaine catabolism B
MYAILTRVDDTAQNIKTFWFKPETPARYIAGQFIEFYLLHDPHDDRGTRRWFTLSSSPSEDLLSTTTKLAVENGSTFKQTLSELPLGSRVMFSEPMGDFVLPKDTTIPLVFVAGGIGVTPMRSMVKWLTDKGEKRDVTILYGARDKREIAFRDLFEAYCGDQFKTFTERPITSDDIIAATNNKPEALIYLAGPEPMVEKYVAELKQAGVPARRLVTDYFPGYPGT